MSRDKFLMLIVGFLLLLNTATLAYLFLQHRLQHAHHPHRFGHHHRPPVHFLEPLQFDDAQQEAFEHLVHKHRSQMHSFDNKLANVGRAYVTLIHSHPMDSVLFTTLNDSISLVTSAKNAATLEHIREVRALCRAEQLPVFDSVLPEFSRLIAPDRRMPPPHHRH